VTAAEKLQAPRERPILFSGPMVRALLDGRKTQTRRVVKPQPTELPYLGKPGLHWTKWKAPRDLGKPLGGFVWQQEEPCRFPTPYGQPGDRLWVRETFIHEWPDMDRPEDEDEYRRWIVPHYAATDPKPDLVDQNTERPIGWRPSIYMPRWACRLELELTEVRVQRLQDISEEDATAEGADHELAFLEGLTGGASWPERGNRMWFRALWDSLNAERGYGWNANPFVWALTVKRAQ